jgi:hypothetical protein
MSDYKVTVHRTTTREVILNISAMDEADAKQFALEQSADIDFHDCKHVDTFYEIDACVEIDACDGCGEEVSGCGCRSTSTH